MSRALKSGAALFANWNRLPHAEFLLAGNRLRPEEFSISRAGWEPPPYIRTVPGCEAGVYRSAGPAEKTFEPGHPSIATGNRIWRWCSRIWGSWRKRAICCARRWPPLRRPSSPDTPPSPHRQSNLALVLKDLGQFEEAARSAPQGAGLRREDLRARTPIHRHHVNRISRWCSGIWGSWRKRAICCARRWPPMRRRSSPDTPPSPAVNRISRGAAGSGPVGGSARSAAQGAGLR